METQSPSDRDAKRKRRRLSPDGTFRRPSEGASSAGELGSMRKGLAQGSSSFVGSGSGIYFVRTVQAAFARNYSRQGSEAIDEDMVPGEDDRLQASNMNPAGSLWNSNEVDFVSPNQPATDFNFDDMVHWSRPYFDNWHPPFPFLQGTKVLDSFERTSSHGIHSLNVLDAIVVRSVLSMSLADRRQMPQEARKLIPSDLVFLTINDAIACLNSVMMQSSTLTGLQSLVAIQSFLISMLHLNAASRFGGVIVSIAFHLGLHRCPSRYEQFSLADADIRRRIFWTIYTLERYLSQSLGLPLNLKDDDIDVCYPDNELHQVRDQKSMLSAVRTHGAQSYLTLLINSLTTKVDPRVLLLPTSLGRHGTIRGMILELRHISVKHRTTEPEEVTNIEAAISKWWNEAQDLLEPHYVDHEDHQVAVSSQDGPILLKASHKLLLVVQKHESTILLNRPVLSSVDNSTLYSAAMQKCIGASKQIVSKVYQHLYDGMVEVNSWDGKILNPLIWPGFTWSVWMSGLILLYAASEGHYSTQIAQREADRCIKILESLSLRGNFWPGACASALKDLQKALARKGTTEDHPAKAAPWIRTGQLPQHGVLQNTPSSTQNQGPSRANGDSSTQQENNHAIESSISPSGPFEFTPRDSQRTQGSQPAMMNSASANLGIGSQDMPASLANQEGLLTQNVDFNYGDWQEMGVNFGDILVSGAGRIDDIFQFMDVPYQLSDQILEPGNFPRH